jgi:hypothetical protein
MLRFQSQPDDVFTAILKDGIEYMIESIKEFVFKEKDKKEANEDFKWLLPDACKVYNPNTAVDTLKRMLICLERPRLYYLNDYHYLLLFDSLEHFCVVHNDLVNDAPTSIDREEVSQIGDYFIEKLLFDEMVDIYFYDTDFLFDPEAILDLGLKGRQQMAINQEAFAITQGLAPHPEELKIGLHKGEIPIKIASSPYFGSTSKVYPDFDYIKGDGEL